MGKNHKKGKNGRCCKRNENNSNSRELLFKEEGQDYARIEKALGSGRFNARSFSDADGSGVVRLAIRRGALSRVTIIPGDIVLLGLREWQDGKADIIHKYSANESWRLQARGELPLKALRESKDEESNGPRDENDGDGIVFGNDEDDDDDGQQPHIDIDAI
ncbi:nucleic acid-binding protein [Xylaria scruposa]|nr:nucleic acid-binding protein [Xylaria scruposa]